MKKYQQTREKLLREYIKRHIKQVIAENEENEEEQQDQPEQDQEVDIDAETAEARRVFTSKLKQIPGASEVSNMSEILSAVIQSFGLSNEQKLSLLRSIKSNIVR